MKSARARQEGNARDTKSRPVAWESLAGKVTFEHRLGQTISCAESRHRRAIKKKKIPSLAVAGPPRMELGFECLSKGDLHLLKPMESVRLARSAVGTTRSFCDADLWVPALQWCVNSGFPLGHKALVLALVPVTYILVPSLLGVHGGVGGRVDVLTFFSFPK